VNPLIERFWPVVASKPGRTLVPLCGKSVDMAWLAGRGYEVVGIDVSEVAARAFFSEQASDFAVWAIRDDAPFKVFEAGRVTILVGDFFDLTPDRFGRFAFVYDRAALIAMPREQRPAYVARLLTLLEEEGNMLLITIDYNSGQMAGPPFSVPEPEVRALFAGNRVDKLDEYDCLDTEPRFRERGLSWMTEVVYHVRR
jgi:thiopurine S-methyltransferase